MRRDDVVSTLVRRHVPAGCGVTNSNFMMIQKARHVYIKVELVVSQNQISDITKYHNSKMQIVFAVFDSIFSSNACGDWVHNKLVKTSKHLWY